MTKFKKNKSRKGGRPRLGTARNRARKNIRRRHTAPTISPEEKQKRAAAKTQYETKMAEQNKKMEVAEWFQKFAPSQFFNSIFDYFDENTGEPIENKDIFVVNDEVKDSIDWDKFIKAEANLKLIQKELGLPDETIALMGTYATNVNNNHLYISNDNEKALKALSKEPFPEEEKKAFKNYFTNIPWGKEHLAEIKKASKGYCFRSSDMANKCPKKKAALDLLNKLKDLKIIEPSGGRKKKRTRRRKKRKRKKTKTKKRRRRRR